MFLVAQPICFPSFFFLLLPLLGAADVFVSSQILLTEIGNGKMATHKCVPSAQCRNECGVLFVERCVSLIPHIDGLVLVLNSTIDLYVNRLHAFVYSRKVQYTSNELHGNMPEGMAVKRDGNELKYHDFIAQTKLLFQMMIDNNNAEKRSPVATCDELKINKILVKTRWQLSHSNRFIYSNKNTSKHTHTHNFRWL